MNLAVAIIVGAAMIAAAVAFSQRYGIVTHECGDNCSRAWIVNHWTGRAMVCDLKIIGEMPVPKTAVCFGTSGQTTP